MILLLITKFPNILKTCLARGPSTFHFVPRKLFSHFKRLSFLLFSRLIVLYYCHFLMWLLHNTLGLIVFGQLNPIILTVAISCISTPLFHLGDYIDYKKHHNWKRIKIPNSLSFLFLPKGWA